jgi:hypothetical protein
MILMMASGKGTDAAAPPPPDYGARASSRRESDAALCGSRLGDELVVLALVTFVSRPANQPFQCFFGPSRGFHLSSGGRWHVGTGN